MPYQTISDLPNSVKDHLPSHAQEIFLAAFNNAWEEYDQPNERLGDESREQVARKVAWAAVKKKYEKDENTGQWKPKM